MYTVTLYNNLVAFFKGAYSMKKRRGQALVETALVFPFFLLIVIGGIIDFGFAFYNHLTLQQIVNNTAKYAAYNNASTIKTSEYANSLKPKWWEGNFSVYPAEPVEMKTGGKIYKVTLSYDCPAYTPFYKMMYKATNGAEYIKLYTSAAYKAPEHLAAPKSGDTK